MTEVSALRRRTMQAVQSKNTQPELLVRRLVHGLGYRYRLHRRDLPGNPDLVFPSRRKVIFVHGCFWHGHHCGRGARVPRANQAYWVAKIQKNQDRGRNATKALAQDGWGALVLWECELRNEGKLREMVVSFLGPTKQSLRKE